MRPAKIAIPQLVPRLTRMIAGRQSLGGQTSGDVFRALDLMFVAVAGEHIFLDGPVAQGISAGLVRRAVRAGG